MLDAAARGEFPPPDGILEVFPSASGRADAIVGFTAHFVLAADIDEAAVRARVPAGDFSVPLSAPFLTWLGEQLHSRATTFDALLAAIGTGSGVPEFLHEVDDLDHPRVARASRYRRDMRLFTTHNGEAVLAVGRGICGRWEIGYEVAPAARGSGLGRRIVEAARAIIPAGQPVFAQVAPGNAASMRSTMAGGFVPIAAEVLFPRDGA